MEFVKGLRKVAREGNLEELQDFYNKNAKDYEKYSEFTGKEAGALALAEAIAKKHTDKNTCILDVAAGTGIVGVQLKKLGYEEVDALDFSQGMLDLAKSKDIYKQYVCDTIRLNEKTQIDDDTYDVLCMNGGVTPGQITPDMLPEFTRMTRSGGSIVFNVTDKVLNTYPEFREANVDSTLQTFVEDGSWVEWTKQVAPFFGRLQGKCKIYIATVA